MKLSELDPQEVQVVSHPPDQQQGGLKLSDLHPDEVEHVSSPDQEPISQTESALRGAAQGASLGYSDEAIGALGAITSPVQILGADDKLAKMKQLYQQYRDMERQKNEAAEKANPKTYLAGNVAGGIGGAALGIGELGAGLKGAAALGAVTGLGTSNADLTEGQYGRAALDTGIGGTIGAIGGKVAEKVGGMLSPKALTESASENVANAIGAKGLPSARQKVGQAVIESGALKGGINEGAIGGFVQARNGAEAELQPLLQKVKDGLVGIDPEQISESLGGDAGDKVLDLIQKAHDSMSDMSSDVGNEFAEKIAPKMQDYVMKLKEAGNDPVRLNQIKRAATKQGDDAYEAIFKAQKTGQSLPADFEQWAGMAKQIGSVVKNHIEGLAGIADPTLNLQESIIDANKTLGGLSGAKKALTSKLSKGDTGIKTSNPIEYAYNPKWAVIKDIVKNLNSDGIRVGKANMQTNLANRLTNSGIGESLSSPAQKIAGQLTRSTPMMESAQQFTGSPKVDMDKPAEVSRTLYNQSDEQLKGVADTIGKSPGHEHVGASLNNALNNKDVAAKNAALFVMSDNPKIRAILKDSGLLA